VIREEHGLGGDALVEDDHEQGRGAARANGLRDADDLVGEVVSEEVSLQRVDAVSLREDT
jgi:hypothetical protein